MDSRLRRGAGSRPIWLRYRKAPKRAAITGTAESPGPELETSEKRRSYMPWRIERDTLQSISAEPVWRGSVCAAGIGKWKRPCEISSASPSASCALEIVAAGCNRRRAAVFRSRAEYAATRAGRRRGFVKRVSLRIGARRFGRRAGLPFCQRGCRQAREHVIAHGNEIRTTSGPLEMHAHRNG